MDRTTEKAKPEGVRETYCASWDDFIRKVRAGWGRFVSPPFYRGHGQPGWRLSSMFERWLWRQKGGDLNRSIEHLILGGMDGRDAFETLEVERFKRFAQALPGIDLPEMPDTDTWLCLGRQHGVVTPLLDWTWSPFIAAFFACTSAANCANPGFENGRLAMILHSATGGGFTRPGMPMVIWSLSPYDDLEVHREFEVLAHPPLRSARLHAQKGLYTRLRHPVHVDLQSYLESRERAFYLERFEIPGWEVFKALGDLQRMGITYASMFPDLDGAAKQANAGRLWDWTGPWIEDEDGCQTAPPPSGPGVSQG